MQIPVTITCPGCGRQVRAVYASYPGSLETPPELILSENIEPHDGCVEDWPEEMILEADQRIEDAARNHDFGA